MTYDWEDKEAECYRLYVEEKKSMDEVMAYWAAQGFTPSKRGFQTQFKRWDFPGKQNPAYKNDALVARTHELWNQNYSQKDMLHTLQSEGFHINDRELTRLRLRLNLFLRESVPRPRKGSVIVKLGTKEKEVDLNGDVCRTRKGSVDNPTNALPGRARMSEETSEGEEAREDGDRAIEEAIQNLLPENQGRTTTPSGATPLSEEQKLQKQLRRRQLQLESDEKWRNRKRRRRTRGWAGLPADAPNEPPRFPSETTIDEAKAYLGLTNDMYRDIRERFSVICKAEGVIKKTVAGPEIWVRIVQQLIREDPHLSNVFRQEPEVFVDNDGLYRPKGQRALSLDVICMDVTKRLRVIDTRKPLADAKIALGLNPEETRQVRHAFVGILIADHFTSKHEAGDRHWSELKQTWIDGSPLLRRAVAQGAADPEYAEKLRAIEMLARDAVKRDLSHKKKTPDQLTTKKKMHTGPGPGPAPPVLVPHPSRSQRRSQRAANTAPNSTERMAQDGILALSSAADFQIDPSLLLAASDAAIIPTPLYQPAKPFQNLDTSDRAPQTHTSERHIVPQSSTSLPSHHISTAPTSGTPPPTQPLPVYFRLHPHSQTPLPTKTLWLSILPSPSYAALRSLVTREHPGTSMLRLEGLLTYVLDGEEKEVPVEVGNDEELRAYLDHVVGKKASFMVSLGK